MWLEVKRLQRAAKEADMDVLPLGDIRPADREVFLAFHDYVIMLLA